MERLLPFQFERTRYLVGRQGEWAFFLRVADGGTEGVHIDIDFTNREHPSILNPRRFTFPIGEGISLEMERVDGTEEAVTIWPDSLERNVVMVGLELPDGVMIQPFEDDDDEAAAG